MGRLSCWDMTQGIAARLMFGFHGILGVLLAFLVTKNHWYWFLNATILLFIIEGVVTIKIYKKKWKWVVPCIFIYLCMVVPSLLLVEHTLMTDSKKILNISAIKSNIKDNNGAGTFHIHNIPELEKITAENDRTGKIINNNMSLSENSTTNFNHTDIFPMSHIENSTAENDRTDKFPNDNMSFSGNSTANSNHTDIFKIHKRSISGHAAETISNVDGNSLSESMWMQVQMAAFSTLCQEDEESSCNWEDTVQVYKQSFIFVLIIGCWLDPMTSLNREEKSQLLLINIGVASDVLEFLEMAKEIRNSGSHEFRKSMMDAPFLLPTILAIWTWSLLQFMLLFKPSHLQSAIIIGPPQLKRRLFGNTACYEVLFTLLLMDIPYLVFRLLMIFYFRVFNNSIIFFASKNSLMIIIQIYRIFAVQIETRAAVIKADATATWRKISNQTAAQRFQDSLRDTDKPAPELQETLLEDDTRSSNDDNRDHNDSSSGNTFKRISAKISTMAVVETSDTSNNDSTTQRLTDDCDV